ncbi:MAG: hypothetical protein HC923_11095, partial [Myxococcales bacterium]|nr:hypothetical protein [Myxococcales bacterium]
STTGTGGTRVYGRLLGSTPPEGISDDPLLGELDWSGDHVRHYYVPEPSVFEVVAKFRDGTFGRLTPDGTRYRYLADGRLERIEHRYESPDPAGGQLHRQVLAYERGRLRRISDLTYPQAVRHLELGYVLRTSDVRQELTPPRGGGAAPNSLDDDVASGSPSHLGRLARVVDFVGRTIELSYDAEGRLEHVEGVEVTEVEAGGATGRPATEYGWSGDHTMIESLTPPHASGVPLLRVVEYREDGRASSVESPDGEATSITYTHGPRSLDLSGSAETTVEISLASTDPTGGSTALLATETYAFGDMYGTATSVTRSTGATRGPSEVTTGYQYRDGALLEQVDYPKGNSVTVHLSGKGAGCGVRGRWRRPFATVRTGDCRSSTPTYDDRYHFPTGTHTDFDGVTRAYIADSNGCSSARIQPCGCEWRRRGRSWSGGCLPGMTGGWISSKGRIILAVWATTTRERFDPSSARAAWTSRARGSGSAVRRRDSTYVPCSALSTVVGCWSTSLWN